jgi:hypothetical protein
VVRVFARATGQHGEERGHDEVDPNLLQNRLFVLDALSLHFLRATKR